MSTVAYKPKRLGIKYPQPSKVEWRRILRKCKRVDTGHASPCWIFTGRIDVDGYGEAKYRGAKRFTHRIAYAWQHGETPARRDVEHLCKQHACCNPAHLDTLPPKINAGGRSEEMPTQVNRTNLSLYQSGRGVSLPI